MSLCLCGTAIGSQLLSNNGYNAPAGKSHEITKIKAWKSKTEENAYKEENNHDYFERNCRNSNLLIMRLKHSFRDKMRLNFISFVNYSFTTLVL